MSRRRKRMPIAVDGAAPLDVPIKQVKALCAEIGHLDRLCARMLAAAESAARLDLRDSEAVLLAAEIRHSAITTGNALDGFADALLAPVQHLHTPPPPRSS